MAAIGKVSFLFGTVFAEDAAGNQRLLLIGDEILEGERIITVSGAKIEIDMLSGDQITVADGQSWSPTGETFSDPQTFAAADATLSPEDLALQEALLTPGADPTQFGEATAAGNPAAGAPGTAAGDGGTSFVTIERTANEVNPDAGYETIGTNANLVTPVIDPQQINDDAPVPPTIISVVPEGSDGSGAIGGDSVTEGQPLVFTISMSSITLDSTTFTFTLGGGSASTIDYGQLIFSEGVTDNGDGTITLIEGLNSFTATLPTIDDTEIELTESVPLTVGGITGIGQILDNDQPTIISVEPGTPGVDGDAVIEGVDLVFNVTLSAETVTAVTYSLNLGGGSASTADYTALTFSDGVVNNLDGTITVPPTVTTFTATLPTVDDTEIELTESVPIIIGGVAAAGSIIDNDKPTIVTLEPNSAGDVVVEGNNLVFTATLSAAPLEDVTYDFNLGTGTATAGNDYTILTFDNNNVVDNGDGTITVRAGVTSFTAILVTIDDSEIEVTETVPLTIGGVTAIGSITDNDKPIIQDATVSIVATDNTAIEGNFGDPVVFTISRDIDNDSDSTVHFNLANSGDSGLESTDIKKIVITDFIGTTTLTDQGEITAFLNSGQNVVLSGAGNATVELVPFDDDLIENAEAFSGNITAVANGKIGSGSDSASFHDEDGSVPDNPRNESPSLAITASKAQAIEGEPNGGDTVVFDVTRSGNSEEAVEFRFELGKDGLSGLEASDITSITYVDAAGDTQSVTSITAFLAGTEELLITIPAGTGYTPQIVLTAADDDLIENVEKFSGNISTDDSNVEITSANASANASIKDEDGENPDNPRNESPSLAITASKAQAIEGEPNGGDTVVFDVTRSGNSEEAVEFRFELGKDGLSGLEASDITSITYVDAAGDTQSVTSITAFLAGTEELLITIPAGTGYTPQIVLTAADDDLIENVEKFSGNISTDDSNVEITAANASANASIKDEDGENPDNPRNESPSLAITASKAQAIEGEPNSGDTVVFDVTRSGNSEEAVEFRFELGKDGLSGLEASDITSITYVDAAGDTQSVTSITAFLAGTEELLITIPAGTGYTPQIVLTAADDDLIENVEKFSGNISTDDSNVEITAANASANASIKDEDGENPDNPRNESPSLAITASKAQAIEGEPNSGDTVVFDVTRSGNSEEAVEFRFELGKDGLSGLEASDITSITYVDAAGDTQSVTSITAFLAGTEELLITIPAGTGYTPQIVLTAADDDLIENVEKFSGNISTDDSNVEITAANASANASIKDEDGENPDNPRNESPSLAITASKAQAIEGEPNSGDTVVFDVTRSGNSEEAVEFRFELGKDGLSGLEASDITSITYVDAAGDTQSVTSITAFLAGTEELLITIPAGTGYTPQIVLTAADDDLIENVEKFSGNISTDDSNVEITSANASANASIKDEDGENPDNPRNESPSLAITASKAQAIEGEPNGGDTVVFDVTRSGNSEEAVEFRFELGKDGLSGLEASDITSITYVDAAGDTQSVTSITAFLAGTEELLITIPAGTGYTPQIVLTAADDDLIENVEKFSGNISTDDSNVEITAANASANASIKDEDGENPDNPRNESPSLAITASKAQAIEGEPNGGDTVVFDVTRSGNSEEAVEFRFELGKDGLSGLEASDITSITYVDAAGDTQSVTSITAFLAGTEELLITIPAGTGYTPQIVLTAADDDLIENVEKFSGNISTDDSNVEITAANASANASIKDEDGENPDNPRNESPSLAITASKAQAIEGEPNSGDTVVFDVTRSGNSEEAVEFRFELGKDGLSGLEASDITSITYVDAAGDTQSVTSITAFLAGTEELLITIPAGTGYTPQIVLTAADDDLIENVEKFSGNISTDDSNVEITSANASANASIKDEDGENPDNPRNESPSLAITASKAQAIEGEPNGGDTVVFDVTRSGNSEEAVEFRFELGKDGLSGLEASDITSITYVDAAGDTQSVTSITAFLAGTEELLITIPAGTGYTPQIVLTAADDDLIENVEKFSGNISTDDSNVEITAANASANASIKDEDGENPDNPRNESPSLAITASKAQAIEGEPNSGDTVVFDVTRSGNSEEAVEFRFELGKDGLSGLEASDITSITYVDAAGDTQSVTSITAFLAGTEELLITIPAGTGYTPQIVLTAADDDLIENVEKFSGNISTDDSNVEITAANASANASIKDEDGENPDNPRNESPSLAITASKAQAIEGEPNSGDTVVFDVTRSGNSEEAVEFRFELGKDGLSGLEASDITSITYVDAAGVNHSVSDIAAFLAGTETLSITIPAGSSYKPQIVLTAANDGLDEGLEKFSGNISTNDQNVLIKVASANASIDDGDDDPYNLVATASGDAVSEEGLTDGLIDGTPNGTDTTDDKTFDGLFTFTDMQNNGSGDFSINLEGLSNSFSSSDLPVNSWVWNAATKTLTGSTTDPDNGDAIVQPVMTIKVGDVAAGFSAGSYQAPYTVTLLETFDHPIKGVEDVLDLSFKFSVTEAGGATVEEDFSVKIEDDMPVAVNTTQEFAGPEVDTNLMIVLDMSGSMNRNANGDNGYDKDSRLDLAKLAIVNLINQYDDIGEVKVRIVTFDSLAQKYTDQWVNLGTAVTYIQELDPPAGDAYTNYDAALYMARDAFGNDDGKLIGSDVQNVSYFFSDGQPNRSDGVVGNFANSAGGPDSDDGIQTILANPGTVSEEQVWQEFLKSADINSISIGLGSGVNESNLNPIAYNGLTETDATATIVDDLSDLDNVLSDTVVPVVTGNIFSDPSSSVETGFGADGGHVEYVTLDVMVGGTATTVRFTYNKASDEITNTSTGNDALDVIPGSTLTVTTKDGVFILDMLDGAYKYQLVDINAVVDDLINYKLIDNDGDGADGALTLKIGTPNLPLSEDFTVTLDSRSTTIDFSKDNGLLSDSTIDGAEVSDVETLAADMKVVLIRLPDPDKGSLYFTEGNVRTLVTEAMLETASIDGVRFNVNQLEYEVNSNYPTTVNFGEAGAQGAGELINWGDYIGSDIRKVDLVNGGEILIKSEGGDLVASVADAGHRGGGLGVNSNGEIDQNDEKIKFLILDGAATASNIELKLNGLGSHYVQDGGVPGTDSTSARVEIKLYIQNAAGSLQLIDANTDAVNIQVDGNNDLEIRPDGSIWISNNDSQDNSNGNVGNLLRTVTLTAKAGVEITQVEVGLAGDGSFEIAAVDINYNLNDSFDYLPVDGAGNVGTDIGGDLVSTVNLEISGIIPLNQAPIAVNDVVNNAAGNGHTINVLDNGDRDPDGTLDSSSVQLIAADGSSTKSIVVAGEGTWTVNSNGSVTFVAAVGFSDDPTPVKYTVADNQGLVSNQADIDLNFDNGAVTQVSTGTNLVIMLDTSGSMGESSDKGLKLAIKAIERLFEQYKDAGEVAVKLSTFNKDAQSLSSSWMSLDQAKTELEGIDDPDHGTNYDAAIEQIMKDFTTGSAGQIDGGRNVSYFISDGVPTLSDQSGSNDGSKYESSKGDGIEGDDVVAWESFLDTHNISSYSVGLYTESGDVKHLEPIAYDGADDSHPAHTPIIINNNGEVSKLDATVIDIGNTYQGTAGNDTITGTTLNDSLFGNAGDDILFGDAGDDIFFGGSGQDSMTGGTGADSFVFTNADVGSSIETDTIFGFDKTEDNINLSDLLDASASRDNLDEYLTLTKDASDDTVILVSQDRNGSADHQILLKGVDLGDHSLTTLQDLLDQGALIID